MLRKTFAIALGFGIVLAIILANSLFFRFVVPVEFEGWSFAGQHILIALVLGSWVILTLHREGSL